MGGGFVVAVLQGGDGGAAHARELQQLPLGVGEGKALHGPLGEEQEHGAGVGAHQQADVAAELEVQPEIDAEVVLVGAHEHRLAPHIDAHRFKAQLDAGAKGAAVGVEDARLAHQQVALGGGPDLKQAGIAARGRGGGARRGHGRAAGSGDARGARGWPRHGSPGHRRAPHGQGRHRRAALDHDLDRRRFGGEASAANAQLVKEAAGGHAEHVGQLERVGRRPAGAQVTVGAHVVQADDGRAAFRGAVHRAHHDVVRVERLAGDERADAGARLALRRPRHVGGAQQSELLGAQRTRCAAQRGLEPAPLSGGEPDPVLERQQRDTAGRRPGAARTQQGDQAGENEVRQAG